MIFKSDSSHKKYNMISNIYEKNFPDHLRDKSREFKKTIKDYDYVDLLFDNNDKLLAFGLLNLYPNLHLLHLDYMALDKSYQGNGNGSKYLNILVDKYCKSNKKIKYMILECEDHLVTFYEKNNFHKINYNYKYDGIKLNLMLYGKKLNPSLEVKLADFLSGQFLSHDCEIEEINTYLVIKYIDQTQNLMMHFIVLILNSTLKAVFF